MSNLQNNLEATRLEYRKVFSETVEEISSTVDSLRPDIVGDIFDDFEKDSLGYGWQKRVLKFLEDRLKEVISDKTGQISKERDKCKCIGCGSCCRFAVSEFSPSALQIKAENGDKIAKEFIKTFVPYNSIEEAQKVFPEYIELLEEEGCSNYYIYHCPKVTEDNRCPDYENRPKICRDFPDNPVAFLPLKCSYSAWKLKSKSVSLKLRAEVEIIDFYIEKLKGILNR